MPTTIMFIKPGETIPTSLDTINREICTHLGVQPSMEKYYLNWYSNIGLLLALDRNISEIKSLYEDAGECGVQLTKIAEFLEEHYTIYKQATPKPAPSKVLLEDLEDEPEDEPDDDDGCPMCNGTGEGLADGTRCPMCNGRGYLHPNYGRI